MNFAGIQQQGQLRGAHEEQPQAVEAHVELSAVPEDIRIRWELEGSHEALALVVGARDDDD